MATRYHQSCDKEPRGVYLTLFLFYISVYGKKERVIEEKIGFRFYKTTTTTT